MGWFIGIHGKSNNLKSKVLEHCPAPKFQVDTNNFFVAGNGLDSTFFHHSTDKQDSGWIASGIGISNYPDPSLFDSDDWNHAISKGAEYLHSINGHFSVVKWNRDETELITDQLGMRNIFIHQGKDFILFSTRLDWIKHFIPKTSIIWEKFGSRWMGLNQFSSESFINGIYRISQGGTATYKSGELKILNNRWTPSLQKETSVNVFENALLSFSTLPLKAGRRLSLGLSGGLDSRTLFASLLHIPSQNWGLHTFGESDHPDLQTAALLNKPFGRLHHIFREEIPDTTRLAEQLPEFVGQTLFTSAPSHSVGFQAYQKLNELDLSIVDGAFGEIARRRFMVSVYLRAKKAVLQKNTRELLPLLKLHRANIFYPDVDKTMLTGFQNELDAELQAMPEASEIGLENWLDLFTIRTRVHNTAGPEQARSDALIFNYMPFLQPELTEMALNLPLKERKNARLFRRIIKESAPQLEKIPLVKGTVSYPYRMKDLSSALWMRMKKKLGKEYHSSLQADFLLKSEDYVRDLFNSQSAREFPPYDQKKIQRLVTGFYNENNHSLAYELNWALAFEVFRRI